MRLTATLSAAALVTLAAPALATDSITIYPYASHANYCPAGLQPVSVGGVICCGTPNTNISYQEVMRHPVKKRARRHVARYDCPVGVKGC